MTIGSLFIVFLSINIVFAGEKLCQRSDNSCKELEAMFNTRRYLDIINVTNTSTKYSEGSTFYIGQAYDRYGTEVATTFEDKEKAFDMAVNFKNYHGYMSLYMLYKEKNKQLSIKYLKKYIKTNPTDPDPYVIFGELQLANGDYLAANETLKKAKILSKTHTASIDWSLFKINYLLKNFRYSREMLDNAFAQGNFVNEFRALVKNPAFKGLRNNKEYSRYFRYLND